jgi:hypothetical protein
VLQNPNFPPIFSIASEHFQDLSQLSDKKERKNLGIDNSDQTSCKRHELEQAAGWRFNFHICLKPPHEDLFFTHKTDWIFRHDSSDESCGGGESQVPCQRLSDHLHPN